MLIKISESVQELNEIAISEGLGNEDTSAIIKLLDKKIEITDNLHKNPIL